MAPGGSESEDVVICCLDEGSDALLYSLRISHGFSWALLLRGVPISRSSCPLLTASPELLMSAGDICHLLVALDSFRICEGNSDEKFLRLSHSRKGTFVDVSGNTAKVAL